MRRPRKRVLRPHKIRVKLYGGPFHGHTLYLEPGGKDTATLPFGPINGFSAGRYVGGQWSPL